MRRCVEESRQCKAEDAMQTRKKSLQQSKNELSSNIHIYIYIIRKVMRHYLFGREKHVRAKAALLILLARLFHAGQQPQREIGHVLIRRTRAHLVGDQVVGQCVHRAEVGRATNRGEEVDVSQ
jgi:hypothetical protein